MNKRLITIGFLILGIALLAKSLFFFGKNIKVDEFHKAAVVFILESSASNKNKLAEEIKYIKSLCAILDPEDSVKIIKTANSSYLIYEGNPSDATGISKAIETYTKDNTNSTSYGEAIKKSVEYSLTMKKDGYVPAVVVVGSLENSGDYKKQINWDVLPKNIQKTKDYIPELAMMFVYASPEKLDEVKTKLNPILGEKKLIVATEVNVDKANRRFLDAIGR